MSVFTYAGTVRNVFDPSSIALPHILPSAAASTLPGQAEFRFGTPALA